METTKEEKSVIEDILKRKNAHKKKWGYLLAGLVDQKKTIDKSYADIAEWLTKEGLEMNEHTLRKLIWKIKNKLKSDGSKKNKTIASNQPDLTPIMLQIELPEEKNAQHSKPIDYNKLLEKRVQEARLKNTGFDAFKDL